MSRETIAKALKRLRLQSGFTAGEVGRKIGKSGKTVNAWENNHGQPDAEILIQLCDIYNVDNILKEFTDESVNDCDHQKEQLLENYEKLNENAQYTLVRYSDFLTEDRANLKDDYNYDKMNA